MTVSRDSLSSYYLPASAAEWTELLAGSGLSNPSNLWLMQEANGNLVDTLAAKTQTLQNIFGTLQYQQAVTGWTRKAVTMSDGSIINFNNNGGTGVNLGTKSALWLLFGERTGSVAASPRIIAGMGGSLYANILSVFLDTSNHLGIGTNAAITNAGTVDYGTGTAFPLVLQHDFTNSIQRVKTQQETITKTFSSMTNESAEVFLGSLGGIGGPPFGYMYSALWIGAAAEMSAANITTLFSLLQNGPATSSVAIARNRLVNQGRIGKLTKGSGVN